MNASVKKKKQKWMLKKKKKKMNKEQPENQRRQVKVVALKALTMCKMKFHATTKLFQWLTDTESYCFSQDCCQFIIHLKVKVRCSTQIGE